jgi:hypothetical protein
MMLVLGPWTHKSGSAGVLNVGFALKATQLLRGRENDAMRQNRTYALQQTPAYLITSSARRLGGL